jgi:hypothetical protein
MAPAKFNPHGWGLNVPKLHDTWPSTPDFGLTGTSRVVAALFVAYFAINPLQQLLGVS